MVSISRAAFLLGLVTFSSQSFAMAPGTAGQASESSELSDADWSFLTPDSEWIALKERFKWGSGCSEYPWGGLSGIKEDLEQSLKTGLSCLLKYRPQDAERLRKILFSSIKQPKIVCGQSNEQVSRNQTSIPKTIREGTYAHTTGQLDPDFPLLVFNLAPSQSKEANQSTFFHEMIHWLDYVHYQNVDVTYLAETCCFHSGEIQEKACQLLETESDWLSEAYQVGFYQVMFKRNPEIALETAWEATKHLSGNRDKIWHALETQTNLKEFIPFFTQAVFYTLRQGDEKFDQRHLIFTQISRMTRFLLNDDIESFTRALPAFLKAKKRICDKLSLAEKLELKLLQQISSRGIDDTKKGEWIKGCVDDHSGDEREAQWSPFLSPERLDTEGAVFKDLSDFTLLFEVAIEGKSSSMRQLARAKILERMPRAGEMYLTELFSAFLVEKQYTSGPYSLERMEALLGDPEIFIRRIAAYALRHFDGLDRHQVFQIALEDQDAGVRAAALVSLKRYRGPNLGELHHRLKDYLRN
jgi:hypothetical protein